MYSKKTKIVCTLGPATESTTKIIELIEAGMNIARLNFSHSSYEQHKKIINNIHRAEEKTGKRVGILQDLQGPKIRVGTLEEQKLKKNQDISFPLNNPQILKNLKIQDRVLVNDGLLELVITKVNKTTVSCKTINSGTIKKGNGVHFPDSKIEIATITAKDKKDLQFGLKNNVDFIALSFVKSDKDIKELRNLITKFGGAKTQIISKIERHEAVKSLKSIIKASDGVMVARGDLGVDIPAEEVPIVQKRIIALANKYAKPVITATQVLQSMVKNPRPTRAEISDAANAVFDHTDAIMLSNETAVGKYPIMAAFTLNQVATSIEQELEKHEELIEYMDNKKLLSAFNASCLNACELAVDIKANLIVNYTKDGYTTREIIKHRPHIEIITVTPDEKTARELTLLWGINRVYVQKISASSPEKIYRFLQEKGVIKKGQKTVVICHASKKQEAISTFHS